MKFKPDWDEAKARLTALWDGKPLDRACLCVTAPSGRKVNWPKPKDAETKWLDLDFVVSEALASLEHHWWGGEAIPSYLLMGGWIVNAGACPHFDMSTIWFDSVGEVDFDSPPDLKIDPANFWVRRHAELYVKMAEVAGRNDFLVGQPGVMCSSDMLAFHLGTERFLEATALHPEWVDLALRQLTASAMVERKRLKDLISPPHEFWYGIGGWMPFWAPEPFVATQSDVSCMISPDMYDRFVVPELEAQGREEGPIWYHLDGRDAQQHLPRLLSLPCMKVIQYVPSPCEPPNGIGQLDLYRKIQKAGRIVHVQVSADQIAPMMKALDPALLMLQSWASSPEEGEQLLASLPRSIRRRTSI